MAAVTVTTTFLEQPTDDVSLRMLPYLSNPQRGVVLVAGGSQIIWGGQSGKARAIASFLRLIEDLERML